jgi:hypothetical protein
MKIYKVNFANNYPISCKEVTDRVEIKGAYHYEHDNGRLIYAIIKGELGPGLLDTVATIVEEVKDRYAAVAKKHSNTIPLNFSVNNTA